MIEVTVQPTGDRAEAEDWPSARVAARTLMREAREEGCHRPTATFVVDGELHRGEVDRAGLEQVGARGGAGKMTHSGYRRRRPHRLLF